MPSISEEQKEQVKSLLQAGQLDREEIASKVGVSPGTVSAIKAHITMGTYGATAVTKTETDELIEATEATFGHERDLQLALRSNIQQLEGGLQIIDDGKERITDAGRIDITIAASHCGVHDGRWKWAGLPGVKSAGVAVSNHFEWGTAANSSRVK